MNWKSVLKWILIIAIFVFLGSYLYSSWGEVQQYEFSLSLAPFLLSYIFVFLHFIFVALAWALLLRALRKPGLPMMEAVKIRTVSDFGRFVPGKVWLVLGRVEMSKKFGMPSDVITFSTLMEIFMNILSTVILFVIIFLVIVQHSLSEYALYVLLLLPIPLFLLHPRFSAPFMKLAAKFLKKDYVKSQMKFYYILSLLSVFIVAWIILGIGFYLMVYAIYPVSLSLLLPFTGIFALAWALGFVMIFLPAGLGFREAVLTYFLSMFLPTPIAIIVAIVSRLWLVSGEILTALIFLALRK
tara:strand:- start:151 stop:1044 length:894 start_codon:yes stop_codon:yes gene_type:complete